MLLLAALGSTGSLEQAHISRATAWDSNQSPTAPLTTAWELYENQEQQYGEPQSAQLCVRQ